MWNIWKNLHIEEISTYFEIWKKMMQMKSTNTSSLQMPPFYIHMQKNYIHALQFLQKLTVHL